VSESVGSVEIRHWTPVISDSERLFAGPIVVLTLVFRKKRRNWVGKCLETGTATLSDSLNATRRELIGLVALHLNAVEKAGVGEQYFAERGITVRHKLPTDLILPVREEGDGEYLQPFKAQRAA
jgi:hypothetical protein